MLAALLGCRATPQSPAPLNDVSFTETVNAGQVVGLVLDGGTFRPIRWVTVSLMPSDSPSSSRAGSAAITDSAGRFRLVAPGGGRYNLLVRYICYHPKRLPLRVDSLGGLAALILLTPDRTLDCATGGSVKPAGP